MSRTCKKLSSNLYSSQNTADLQFHRVPRSKLEAYDETTKNLHKNFFNNLEIEFRKASPKSKFPAPDLTRSVPSKLHERLCKVLPKVPVEQGQFEEEIDDTDVKELIKNRKVVLPEETRTYGDMESNLEQEFRDIAQRSVRGSVAGATEPPEIKKREDVTTGFNESTASHINDAERIFLKIDLQVEPKPIPRAERPPGKGWISEFLKKKKIERVKWATKVYQLEQKLLEKQMFDQAEELIDLAASDFSEWINSLSSDSRTNISKNLIKELFPIRLEGDASKTLYVEPKLITAVPEEVGRKWNLPELTLEQNVIKIMKQGRKLLRKKPKRIAFGRTLPVDLQFKKQIQDEMDRHAMKLDFPEELKSKKVLFRGIHHLRSTKALIQYLIDHPELPKPQFLKESGFFMVNREEKDLSHIPLYQYFI